MVIKKASGWIIATAVVFMLLGIFSIIEPGVAGLAVAILVGWVLILGGVAHLVAMFSGRGRSGARNLAGPDRICVRRGRILLCDAPVSGAGEPDFAAGGGSRSGSGVRSRRIFPVA